MSGDRLLTIGQVAELLQVPVSTLRDWRARGTTGPELPAIKIGRQLRYRPADVQAWIESHAEPVAVPRRVIAARRRRSA